jgi:hypothetical protein
MKSLIMKSVYASLGLLNSGKDTVEQLGRNLAKIADLSEKDGEAVARRLRARSDKAIRGLQKTIRVEVNKAVNAIHAATQADVSGMSKKHGKAKGKAKKRSSARKRTTHHKAAVSAHAPAAVHAPTASEPVSVPPQAEGLI